MQHDHVGMLLRNGAGLTPSKAAAARMQNTRGHAQLADSWVVLKGSSLRAMHCRLGRLPSVNAIDCTMRGAPPSDLDCLRACDLTVDQIHTCGLWAKQARYGFAVTLSTCAKQIVVCRTCAEQSVYVSGPSQRQQAFEPIQVVAPVCVQIGGRCHAWAHLD